MNEQKEIKMTALAKVQKVVEDWTTEQIAIIQNSVAKNTKESELCFFLMTAKVAGLSPLLKEIWCYKDKKDNLIIFAGRDGFLKKAQESPTFAGIRSCEVCEKDKFEADIPKGIVNHIVAGFGNRGKIIGAYAFVFRQNGEPTIEMVEFAKYDRKFGAWATHPAEMIKKVAEAHALKKAFGISGIQSEYDYEVNNGVAIPVTEKKEAVVSIENAEFLTKENEKKNENNKK